jgi:hypothetical protein
LVGAVSTFGCKSAPYYVFSSGLLYTTLAHLAVNALLALLIIRRTPSVFVTDYQHCAETQDRRLEGSKTTSTPPYILLADQYCLQTTVPISVTYYPVMSYYLHLLRVYIEALKLHSQSSRSFNSATLQSLQFY